MTIFCRDNSIDYCLTTATLVVDKGAIWNAIMLLDKLICHARLAFSDFPLFSEKLCTDQRLFNRIIEFLFISASRQKLPC